MWIDHPGKKSYRCRHEDDKDAALGADRDTRSRQGRDSLSGESVRKWRSRFLPTRQKRGSKMPACSQRKAKNKRQTNSSHSQL